MLLTRSLTSAAIGMIAAGVLMLETPAAVVREAQGADVEASRLVALAHQWLGGADRVASVRALELVGQTETLKIFLPARYRVELSGPAGRTIVAFDGTQRWQEEPRSISAPPDARSAALRGFLGARATPSPEEARQQGLRTVTWHALRFLLRPLPDYPMTIRVVEDSMCGLPDACLEFRPPNDSPMYLAVDRASGQPKAIIERTLFPKGTMLILEVLQDYRAVDGLRVPFRRTRRTILLGGDAQESESVVYDSVRVNPPLRESDFERPAQ